MTSLRGGRPGEKLDSRRCNLWNQLKRNAKGEKFTAGATVIRSGLESSLA